jgi:hypothetical protein
MAGALPFRYQSSKYVQVLAWIGSHKICNNRKLKAMEDLVKSPIVVLTVFYLRILFTQGK